MESSIFSGIGIDPGIIVIVPGDPDTHIIYCVRHLFFAV